MSFLGFAVVSIKCRNVPYNIDFLVEDQYRTTEWNGEAMTATKMEQISCKDNEAETTFKTANLVLGRSWIKKISTLCPMILPWKHLTEKEAVKKKKKVKKNNKNGREKA